MVVVVAFLLLFLLLFAAKILQLVNKMKTVFFFFTRYFLFNYPQERLYGVPLTDLEGIRKVSDNPEATLVSALNTWTLSVMNCEFFHAVRVVAAKEL